MSSLYYVSRLFKELFPSYSDEICDVRGIGDMEVIFYMYDGSKVIFDELDDSAMFIEKDKYNKDELTDEEWLQEFSRKLKRKLKIRNITRHELADKMGLSYNSICRYSRGEHIPNVLVINKMAKILDCTVEELTDFNYLI